MKRYFILAFIIGISCSSCKNRNYSIVVVDVVKAFESYEMQVELRQEVDEELRFEQGVIDSLTVQANIVLDEMSSNEVSSDIYNSRYQEMYIDISKRQEKLDERISAKVEDYDRMIMKRINSNLELFAKSKDVDLILSKGGNYPGVLYSSEVHDLTNDFIEFLNDDYHGS